MSKIISLFFSLYLLLGTLILPGGDFSVLPKLPSMYQQCGKTHPDMNAFDFVTDHLMNIDGFFDSHASGDPQRPHEPFPFQKQAHAFIPCIVPSADCVITKITGSNKIISKNIFPSHINRYNFDFINGVFHPPIA